MSKFMLMLFDNPAQDINLSPQQMQQVVAEYKQWAEQLARQGKLVGGDRAKCPSRAPLSTLSTLSTPGHRSLP